MQTPAPSAAVLDELKAVLGPGGWTHDPEVIAPSLTEWRNRWTGNTPILLTPRSTEEVARAVTICAREGVAITSQGGGTGLVGGQVHREAMNLGLHNGDAELGFYKFYYQVLHHWILDQNEYTVFCDLKRNRDRTRLQTLQRVLNNANRTSVIKDVQSLPSPEVVLLQLCDVLLGAVSARINGRTDLGATKEGVIANLERRLNRPRLGPTQKSEEKFNIFKIRLGGGW